MNNENNIEQLEDVDKNEEGFKIDDGNKTPEKIEIVEHVESKYDDIKPRTEMGEMTKEEKQEIKHMVLGEEVPKKNVEEGHAQHTQAELKSPSKTGSLLKIVILFTVVLLIFTLIYIFIILPNM